MAVLLTDAAVRRVHTLSENEFENKCLRIAIRGGGCSGLSYHLEFIPAPDDKDKVFEFGDVRVCVDRKSYLFLNGTEIDFEDGVLKTGFVYKNPQATGSCSCGTSFSL